MHLNVFTLFFVLSAVTSLLLAREAWHRRADPAARHLAWLLMGTAAWGFFYGLELSVRMPSLMQMMLSLSYLGIASVPVGWLLMTAHYSGYDAWLTPRFRAALFLVPLLTFVLAATHPLHTLYYREVALYAVAGFTLQRLEPGPFWYLHVAYSYALFGAGMVLLLRLYRHLRGPDRARAGLLLLAGLVPFLLNAWYTTGGYRPYGVIDLTPLGFVVMGLMLGYGILRLRLFDIMPVGLDVLFDTMPDAILFLDRKGCIAAANPVARMLGEEHALPALVDQHLAICLPERTSPSGELATRDVVIGGRTFTCSCRPIIKRGRRQGTLVVLHDITHRQATNAQLQQQMDELRRWQTIMQGREGRVLELKHEVNKLLAELGRDPKYADHE